MTILARSGRGTQYVGTFRGAVLEEIDAHGTISKNELEMMICLRWNVMSRSFNAHFNDMVSFGLVSGSEDRLRLTPKGKDYLKHILQDESVGQFRTRARSFADKQGEGKNPD